MTQRPPPHMPLGQGPIHDPTLSNRDAAVPGGLDDPVYAAFAWGRFRRILGGVALAAAAIAAAAYWWIDRDYGPLGWVATAALLGGVFVTILMAGALMGLAFLSSGSGHDEQVRDFDRVR